MRKDCDEWGSALESDVPGNFFFCPGGQSLSTGAYPDGWRWVRSELMFGAGADLEGLRAGLATTFIGFFLFRQAARRLVA